jgi:hypothetical protein
MKDMSGIFVILVLMFCIDSEAHKMFNNLHFPLQQQLIKTLRNKMVLNVLYIYIYKQNAFTL